MCYDECTDGEKRISGVLAASVNLQEDRLWKLTTVTLIQRPPFELEKKTVDVEVGGGLHVRKRSVHGKVVAMFDDPLQMLLDLVGELRLIRLIWDLGVTLLHAIDNQRHVSLRIPQRERLPLVIPLSLAHVHVAVVAVKKRDVGAPSIVTSIKPQFR